MTAIRESLSLLFTRRFGTFWFANFLSNMAMTAAIKLPFQGFGQKARTNDARLCKSRRTGNSGRPLILPMHFPTPTAGLITADGIRFNYRFNRD